MCFFIFVLLGVIVIILCNFSRDLDEYLVFDYESYVFQEFLEEILMEQFNEEFFLFILEF